MSDNNVAIYRLSSQSIGRSSGKSAVACAAYRAGEKLKDETIGKTFNYEKKQGVYCNDIMIPKDAPEYLKDRQTLWNCVERSETRSNASLAKEYQLALPIELSHEVKVDLVKTFVQREFVDQGLGVDIAFHDFDSENPHCHLMVTTRLIDANGLNQGLKPTFFRERDYLINLRKSWEISVNECLGYHNISQRVCADSYRNQGIDLDGVSYDGYGGNAKQQLEAQQKINGEKLLESPQLVITALNARDATFTKNDMIAFVNRHSLPEQSEKVIKRVICHEQLIDLGSGRFTSLDYLKAEKQLLDSAMALKQRGSHSVDCAFAQDVAERMTLNDSQRCAFDYTLAENSSIKNIIGMAGTGKSHLIKAISEVYQQSGYRVKGLALSGIVAANLSLDANISDSKTLHAFLSSYQGGNEIIDQKTVLVVDEASLIGTKQLSEVVKLVEDHHAKLILVGDNQQLQAINAGGAYRGVINATTHIGLDEIQRQRDEQDKLASLQLATGDVSKAFSHYQADGCVHAGMSLKRSLSDICDRYFKQYDQDGSKGCNSQIVLAYRRDTVKQLNQSIREGFEARGLLGDEKTQVNGREFAIGDRFVFLRNDYDLNVRNGTRGFITRIKGDEWQVKTDDDRMINFNCRDYSDFDHGYAMTIHKSQGVTVDHCHVLFDRHTDRHLAYVGMTRHKETLNIYYHKGQDNQHAVKNFDHLVDLASQSRMKALVNDYRELVSLHESNKMFDRDKIYSKLDQFRDWIADKVQSIKQCFVIDQGIDQLKFEEKLLHEELTYEQLKREREEKALNFVTQRKKEVEKTSTIEASKAYEQNEVVQTKETVKTEIVKEKGGFEIGD